MLKNYRDGEGGCQKSRKIADVVYGRPLTKFRKKSSLPGVETKICISAYKACHDNIMMKDHQKVQSHWHFLTLQIAIVPFHGRFYV